MALCPGLPKKVKPIWILLKQETVSGMAVASAGPYASLHLAPDNHASTPPLSVLQADALPAAQPTASKHGRHV